MTEPRENLVYFLFSVYCFLFYNMVLQPLFNPGQALCCCVFVVSWLFPEVSKCFSVFRHDPNVSEHGGLVAVVVVVASAAPWCFRQC